MVIGSLYRTLRPSSNKETDFTLVWCSDDLNGEEGSVLKLPIGSLCIALGSGCVEDEMTGNLVEWKKCLLSSGVMAWISSEELQEISG